MNFNIDAGTLLGAAGVGFSVASFVMKRMMPLRLLAIAANICFMAYGLAISAWPGLLLNTILLPVNARRVWEIRKLTREIERATNESPVSQWLLPHMHRRRFSTGDIIFRKGDAADKLLYIAHGKVRLEELNHPVETGELLGEIGLFSPDKKRTQTLVCDSDGELYEMTDEMLFQLYYQNPKLGFFIMRLLAERLFRDLRRQQSSESGVAGV